MKKIMILLLVTILLIITSCKKKDNRDPRRTITVPSNREEIKLTVNECIDMGIIVKNMTMEECNLAVKNLSVELLLPQGGVDS